MNVYLMCSIPTFVIGIILTFITVAVLYAFTSLITNRKFGSLPPGPKGFPIVGYLPFVTRKPYLKFHQLRKKYGGVFSVYLGRRYTVVVNDYQSIKEVWSQDACLGRPSSTSFDISSQAISMNDVNGSRWKDNRRLSVRILRDLGFNKKALEDLIKNEVHEFIQVLEANCNRDYDIHQRLTSSISNNITALVFGKRLEYTDPGRQLLDEYFEVITKFFKQISLHSSFPWLKNLLVRFGILDYDSANRNFDNFLRYINKEIEEHKATMETDRMRDYIDGYIQNQGKPGASPYLSNIFLRGNIRSLFGAGTDLVRTTCEWCFLTMACYNDYQKRVQQELDTIIGPEREPALSDQKATPLTQAIIYETFRWIGIQPFTAQRMALKDTTIQGKFIPKCTILLINLWSVLHDEQLWENPEIFWPERFLDGQGQLTKPDFYMPFGKGKRSCPGETMALSELYLYFATVMHRFKVSPPEGRAINFSSQLGVTLQPVDTRLCFTLR